MCRYMKNGLKYVIFKTKWGFFGLLADEKYLLRSVLPMKNFNAAKKYLLVGMFKGAKEDKNMYPQLRKAITDYYKGNYVNFKKLKFELNRDNITNFAKKVLNACKDITICQTSTYGQIAEKCGVPKAARAAGTVLAANNLPLLIGCHRVIRSDGKIGQFSAAGGSKTKRKMLEHEKQILKNKGVNDECD